MDLLRLGILGLAALTVAACTPASGDEDDGGGGVGNGGVGGSTTGTGAAAGAGTTSGSGGAGSGGAGSGGAPGPATYSDVYIDFAEVPNGDVVADQYVDNATFASDPGKAMHACSDACGQESGNFIITDCSGVTANNGSTFVDFARPVRAITFNAVCVNKLDTFARVNLFNDDALLDSVDIVGGGVGVQSPLLVDLSAFSDVTRIEIVDVTDFYGVGWSDFRFEQQDPG